MSTRYVFDRYNIQFSEINFTIYTEETYGTSTSTGFLAVSDYKRELTKYSSSSTDVLPEFYANNPQQAKYIKSDTNLLCSQYPYVIVSSTNLSADTSFLQNIFGNKIIKAPANAYQWRFYTDGGTFRVKAVNSNGSSIHMPMAPSGNFSKGTINSGRFSTNSTAGYPLNGANSNHKDYWYEYLGHDNIDPSAVNCLNEPRAGENVTVSVTPGTGNVYGGTISYQYQYRVNNGSWTDIATTSNTSVSFSVPVNANSIQFRARAQDDMGFISSDYVTGTTATVERLNLWVGVSGKARKGVELYVGVNGKARKVTGAWIGVNGKAKRFL